MEPDWLVKARSEGRVTEGPTVNLAALGIGATPEKRKAKYSNTRVEYDGMRFDSKKELNRYLELRTLEGMEMITDLRRQVKYDLIVKDQRIGAYVADFVYADAKSGETVVEDVKGFRTPEYKLKKRLMKAIHNITILET